MVLLRIRRIRPAYRLFGEGTVIFPPSRDNAVPTFGTTRWLATTLSTRGQRRKTATTTITGNDNEEIKNNNGDKRPVIDEATIGRIEKLALVGFEYRQSKRVLEEAVAFAERLRTARIDETVRPMYSTLENDCIHLRDDVAARRGDVDRRQISKNAAVLEEEYFVAPLMTSKESKR